MTKTQFTAARRAARTLFRDAVAGADTSLRCAPATERALIWECQPRVQAKKLDAEYAKPATALFALFA